MPRPITTCTPALLTMIAVDWSAGELRAAIACLIDLLDARVDPATGPDAGCGRAPGEDAPHVWEASGRMARPG